MAMPLSVSNLYVSANSTSKRSMTLICSSEMPGNLRIAEDVSWNRGLAPKLACMIIGVSVGLLAVSDVGLPVASTMANDAKTGAATPAMVVQQGRSVRWSDARRCPQWSPNSLETVVPENLPRPLSRRSNLVGFVGNSAAALHLRNGGGSCFTMYRKILRRT